MPANYILPGPDIAMSWLVYVLLAFLIISSVAGASTGRQAIKPKVRRQTAEVKPAERGAKTSHKKTPAQKKARS